MKRPISDIAFTSAVKLAQQQRGSREAYAKMEQRGGWQNKVTTDLAEFIAERDSFYLATASADGQPYIQHRGGPKLKKTGQEPFLENRQPLVHDFVATIKMARCRHFFTG